MSPLRNEGKENQASRAGFSIKHVVIDTRKPEMKKATQLHDLNENNNDLLCVLFCKRLNWSWAHQWLQSILFDFKYCPRSAADFIMQNSVESHK